MMEKVKKFFIDLNEKGIPIPLLRDPKVNRGDVAFTNLIISISIIVTLLLAPLFGYKKESLDLIGAIGYMTISAVLYWERKKAIEKILDKEFKKD